jgi:peptidoglycan/LPS O-acetylase OafA/YrhL
MQQTSGTTPQITRMEGLDWLRAVMSVFVVVWHMGVVGRSQIFFPESFQKHVFGLSDILNFHVLLLAVPSFMLVSNFLFFLKGADSPRLKKRIVKLLLLLVFWTIAYSFYQGGPAGLAALVSKSWYAPVLAVITGGGSGFYFFFSLLVCLVLARMIAHLDTRGLALGLAVSIVLLEALPFFAKLSGAFVLCAYWNPVNFLPCTFAAGLLVRNRDKALGWMPVLIPAFLGLAAMTAAFEWSFCTGAVFFQGQGFAIPAYTRVSLMLEAAAVMLVAINPAIRANSVVRFMSKHSLPLYCLHPFFSDFSIRAASVIVPDGIAARSCATVFLIVICYLLSATAFQVYNKTISRLT